MLQLSRLCSHEEGLVYEKRHRYTYVLQTPRNWKKFMFAKNNAN